MEALKRHFAQKGWLILELRESHLIFETREFLQNQLFAHFGRSIPLEEYHLYIGNDEEHTDVQIKMTAAFRAKRWGPQILAAQQPYFQELIGPDIAIQANPYLRITRPHCPQDNIGYHRDTFYGGSPYELSLFVPFVNLTQESSLSVLSGSHIHAETLYPTIQIEHPDPSVKKGSAKHQLGFLYAPKVMAPSIENQMEPIALKAGQALLFSLATVHGSTMNKGSLSRWSSDMRVMNHLAPVDLSARPTYYEPLTASVVTEAARQYFYANEPENRDPKNRDNVQLELCHTASVQSTTD